MNVQPITYINQTLRIFFPTSSNKNTQSMTFRVDLIESDGLNHKRNCDSFIPIKPPEILY